MGIYFWKYKENTKNFPGYHLSIDVDSVDAFLSTVQSQTRVVNAVPKSIKLSIPTKKILSVPNNRQHQAFTKELLNIDVGPSLPSDFVEVREGSRSVNVIFSIERAATFVENIECLIQGQNDFAMVGYGEDKTKHNIWFW